MAYNVCNLPIIIFNAIFSQLTITVNLEESQEQIISYGIDILKNTGEFNTSLTTWFNQPPADMTWANFKKHFTQA